MKRKNRKLPREHRVQVKKRTRISPLKKGSHKHGTMRRKKTVRAETGCK